ncbi:hypothetical protein T4C_2545 [Trichinella pseudospiralis]|uniref:Uncharacterized protein n=1 Tax=Trichinella pseudospiralis TaxID=6337 RepID=A0A0V1K5V6_TRIPS|nr:hypothetical protein T4C_2545 [Trichinella pseudospiralis]
MFYLTVKRCRNNKLIKNNKVELLVTADRRVAQRITRRSTEPKIAGSNPAALDIFHSSNFDSKLNTNRIINSYIF